MSRSAYRGPKLPKTLLDQVGERNAGQNGASGGARKDRRKAEREAKKGARRAGPIKRLDRATQRIAVVQSEGSGDGPNSSAPVASPRKQPTKDAKPLKSILKSANAAKSEPTPETELDMDEDEDQSDVSDGEGTDDSFTVSRQAAKAGLVDADDEIAALERKLGVKGKKKSKEVTDDDLDWLVTGSDSEEEGRSLKRKRPDDAKWLRDKRLKAGGDEVEDVPSDSDADVSDGLDGLGDGLGDDEDEDDVQNPFSDDEISGEDFADFESDADGDDGPPPPKKERENPYVAPVPKGTESTAKYIPPSLRKPASSDEEALKQLRRQVLGQLNRLSDANLLSILQAVEQLYEKNARQHVTSTLVDLLVGLVSDPSVLNDTFIILHAGFAAALYKVIGTDFGAQMLEKVVESFDGHRPGSGTDGKQQLNLIAFLSCLYNFQVIASNILFDYIRLLLAELSEDNAELLLRIVRSSGAQLRQDDPTALKDIVLLLQRNVTERGEANLSVRTKFMIDTIKDLKNNRIKAGAANSAVAAEHTTRIRKTLGTLNTRSVRATEPLRVTLADIRDSEKKGKWWLVGASYHDPAKLTTNGDRSTTPSRSNDADAGYESDTPGHTNLTRAARAQGMNTDIRRLIFVNIVGADDFKDAYQRLQGLKLKSKQQLEVPRVLLHCVGVEEGFNPFYAFLGRRLCQDGKATQKTLQFALWDQVKRMGGAGTEDDGEDADDGEEGGMSVQKVVNLAKFFAFLIADGSIAIAALKTLDFALLQPETKTYVFGEVLLTSLLLEVRKKAKEDGFGERVRGVFGNAKTAPQMIQGLLFFLQTVVAKAGLANGKREGRVVREGCGFGVETLRRAQDEAAVVSSEDDEGDESELD